MTSLASAISMRTMVGTASVSVAGAERRMIWGRLMLKIHIDDCECCQYCKINIETINKFGLKNNEFVIIKPTINPEDIVVGYHIEIKEE